MILHIIYILLLLLIISPILFSFLKDKNIESKDWIRFGLLGSYLWTLIVMTFEKKSVQIFFVTQMSFSDILEVYKVWCVVNLISIFFLFFVHLFLIFIVLIYKRRVLKYSDEMKDSVNAFVLIFNISNVIISTIFLIYLYRIFNY